MPDPTSFQLPGSTGSGGVAKSETEPWRTNAAGPCITIGEVEIWVSLGKGRFRIVAPSGEREIEGFDEARRVAHVARSCPTQKSLD